MNIDNFEKIIVVGDRPEQAPEGHIIFNAPRPLYGNNDWTGDFISGRFFVTIDPNDPDQLVTQAWIDQNRRLDASIVEYMSEADLQKMIDAFIVEKCIDYKIEADDIPADQWRETFLMQDHNPRIIAKL